MEPSSSTLGPVVAGTWYPSDSAVLARQLDEFLENVPQPEDDSRDVVALIEPHAGYRYSGQVAAHGFRIVQRRDPARVILLGPSHYSAFQGAALPDAGQYRTPLGEVPLDVEALDLLGRLPGFRRDTRPFHPEHSLEMEIPFLQHVLQPGWRLLPVLIGGGSSPDGNQKVAEGLRPLLGPDSLVVVSSDFTHYGAHFNYLPFTEDVPENIRRLDMGAIECIRAGDVPGFESYLAKTDATICGRNPIDVLLRMLPRDVQGSLVTYDTSGNLTGDWSHSVSYAALAFRSARPSAGAQ